jgi:acetoin utilization deacetylase AcuC-like enzyme
VRSTLNWADEGCDGRVVCVLEGGYDLDGLAASTAATVHELLGENN